MTTEKGSKQDKRGTFAQLYDVQEQLSRRNAKPIGRPRKKVQRKPMTLHLTQAESRNLSKLHLLVNERCSINRSELAGVAIDVLAALMERKGMQVMEQSQLDDVESFRQTIFNFLKL
jgi:hypothetical protein